MPHAVLDGVITVQLCNAVKALQDNLDRYLLAKIGMHSWRYKVVWYFGKTNQHIRPHKDAKCLEITTNNVFGYLKHSVLLNSRMIISETNTFKFCSIEKSQHQFSYC